MDISEVMEVSSALNSETRLRLLLLLRDSARSTKEVMESYNEEHDEELRRESIFRALEKLRDAGLIERNYSEEGKCFKYSVATDRVTIDFSELE